MTNAAAANVSQEQLPASRKEFFSHPSGSGGAYLARPAGWSVGFPAVAPEYFDDVQAPRLAESHLRNGRLLAAREEIVARLPAGGCYAVVGSKGGAAAHQLLPVVNPGKLYICDTDLTAFDAGPFGAEIARQFVELHQDRVEAQWRRLPNGLFDLVFIQPDHDYSRTMSALHEASRKINALGWIACANYSVYSPLEGLKSGVSRAVNEFCHQNGFEVLFLALHPLGCPDVVLAQKSPRKAEHTGGASLDAPDPNTFMPDIWEYLIDKYCVQSVLDVGAGAGWSTQWFVEKGLYTLGIEGWREALDKNRCRSNVVEHDYTEGPFVPACRFDLAWSAGFVEHIEERFIANFMGTFQSCRYVCLTHSEARQTGRGHVNCQSTEYWIGKMRDYGFDHDPGETFHLRSTEEQHPAAARKTMTFFERRGEER